MFLGLETPEWPCHYGVLMVLDGACLLDPAGRVPLDELGARLERRLSRTPILRQRLHRTGFLQGAPLWVDDQHFDIRRHVHQAALAGPGDEQELLDRALQIYGCLLDRSHPLWDLWFLTGLPQQRVGVLLKLHHTVADGLAAANLLAALTDADPGAPDPEPADWAPAPPPTRRELISDNQNARAARSRSRGSGARPRKGLTGFAQMARVARGFAGKGGESASALNARVRAGRRVQWIEMELAEVKEVAHRHGGKANDVALALWTGGLRRLLLGRGEPVEEVEVTAGQTVTLRSRTGDQTIDNRVGSVILKLPVGEADPAARLDLIVERSHTGRTTRSPPAIMSMLAALAATPIGRYYSAHQRAGNVLCTNVHGPDQTRYLFGAPILTIRPIIELVGNIALTQCAFSYAGKLGLVVTADARSFPDLDELIAGMTADWAILAHTAS